MLIDVLVATFTVEGVVVMTIVLLGFVGGAVSFDDVLTEVSVDLTEFNCVVSVVVGAAVVPVVFGTRESTTPIGPDRSTSDSGQINSSG